MKFWVIFAFRFFFLVCLRSELFHARVSCLGFWTLGVVNDFGVKVKEASLIYLPIYLVDEQ